MKPSEKPLAWMHGEIKSPPFSKEGRLRAGYLLRGLQQGKVLSLPDSRPMPGIGRGCHELRVPDWNVDWRIFYAVRPEAIVILGVEKKGCQRTPLGVIAACTRRLAEWDRE